MTTRFPGGINDHASGNAGMGQFYPQLDPTRYVRYFNDFHNYTAGDWTVTAVGISTIATTTTTGFQGGALVFTGDVNDNDGVQAQLVQESFKLAVGKKVWLRTRFKLSDATDSDALIGLAITDTTLCASLPSDGLYFLKADDATTLIASTRLNGASSSITMGSMANDTVVLAELYYDGKNTFKAFLNGSPVGTDITATTNLCDDEFLTVSMALLNGAAASKTMHVDFIEVLMER